MARKKRRLEPVAVAASETKDKPRYQDKFQHDIGKTVEDAGKKLEGQGRNILYGLAALAVLLARCRHTNVDLVGTLEQRLPQGRREQLLIDFNLNLHDAILIVL